MVMVVNRASCSMRDICSTQSDAGRAGNRQQACRPVLVSSCHQIFEATPRAPGFAISCLDVFVEHYIGACQPTSKSVSSWVWPKAIFSVWLRRFASDPKRLKAWILVHPQRCSNACQTETQKSVCARFPARPSLAVNQIPSR